MKSHLIEHLEELHPEESREEYFSEESGTEEEETLASQKGQTRGVHIERDYQTLSSPLGHMEERRVLIQIPPCLCVILFVGFLLALGLYEWLVNELV